MSHRVFTDITVGETINCGTISVTRKEIIDYATTHDPLTIHTDPKRAADSLFGDIVASGLHTFALTQPLTVEHFYGDSDLIASVQIDNLRFPTPVYPDDTLSVLLRIEDKRVSENNDRRGILTTHRTATVDGETVLSLQNNTIWEC